MSLTESFSPRLTTLGGLHLKPKGFQRPKLLLLLTYLALEHGKSREHLRSLFWAGATDVSASLRVALAQIRNALPGSLEDSGSIVLTRISCDAVDLQTALDASDWERAVNLYTGAFLDGLMLSEFGNELEEWVLTTREYLAGRVVEAHLRLAEQALGHNDLENVKRHANQAHKLPGAPPPEEDTLTRLHSILNAIKSPSATELRREAAELGLELSTASTTATIAPAPTNLPAPTSSFIARETERRYLLETLKDPEARLVTVTGTGGMGKSRLALEVARQLHRENRFKDGVFVAFLEVIESVDAVVSELLRVLQVPIESGQDPQTKLLEHLKNAEILLMLDNLEHLIPFAGQLEQLLEACPKLKVLTTSRERLGLTAEWLLPLEGLPVPNDTEAKPDAPFGAVELFAARAKRQAPAFSLAAQHDSVLEICRLVEGLPLAIELAAALIRAITLPELIEAIKQHPDVLEDAINDPHERHHGMRAVFEQSWKWLTLMEQRTLARMAVFRNGATSTATISITKANLGILTRLVNKSLIQCTTDGRYRLHPVLGRYATEKLEIEILEFKQAKNDFNDYYIAYLRSILIDIRSDKRSICCKKIQEDYWNISEAWFNLLSSNKIVEIKGLEVVLAYFDWSSRLLEALKLFTSTIKKIHEFKISLGESFSLLYSEYSTNLAWVYYQMGNFIESKKHAENSVEIARAAPENIKSSLTRGLDILSNSFASLGDYHSAIQYSKEALRITREIKDNWREMLILVNLANSEIALGLYESANYRYQKAQKIAENMNDAYNLSMINLFECELKLFCMESITPVKAKVILLNEKNSLKNQGAHALEMKIYMNLCDCCIINNDIIEAKDYLLKLDQLNEILNDYQFSLMISLRLGKIYYLEKNFKKALQYIIKSLTGAYKYQMLELLFDNLFYLALVEKKLGNIAWSRQILFSLSKHPKISHRFYRNSTRLLPRYQSNVATTEEYINEYDILEFYKENTKIYANSI